MIERTWLLEISALDGADVPVTLRFASAPYISSGGIYYDLRLKQPGLYTTAAYTGNVIEAPSRSAFGEAVLVNKDGGLDFLADYAVDGRSSLLKLVDEFGVETTIITGTVQSLSFDGDLVSVRLRDPQENLQNDHPHSNYAGNNALPAGVEGVEGDIKGQVKPLIYGQVRNLSAVFVNTARLIYQAHDSSISPSIAVTVTAVYDRGVALVFQETAASLAALEALVVAAGSFARYEGYFKLGATPAGTVTCDIDSAVVALGSVFSRLAIEAGFTLNATDITTTNAFGNVGIAITEVTKTAELFDLLATSIGAYWYFSSATEIRLTQLVSPASPTLTIPSYAVITISRSSNGAGSNGIPVYSVRMQADKIETVQTDLAAAVSVVSKARLADEYRESISSSSAVLTRHPLSEELKLTSALRSLTDANTQAARIQTLLGVRRDSVQAELRLDTELASNLRVGVVVNLTTYKLGYSASKNFILLGYTLDARLSKATLNLWG